MKNSSYNNLWRKRYEGAKLFYRIKYGVKDFFRNIKHTYQRAIRGYSDYDIWDWDEWMQHLLADSIETLAKNCHGHPYDMDEKEWEAYLMEISRHFRNSSDDDWENPIETPPVIIGNHTIDFNDDKYRGQWNKLHAEEEKHYNWTREEFAEGMKMLLEVWEDMWD